MRYTILLSALFLSLFSLAQTAKNKGIITAKVIDSETKVPIEMAIVSLYKSDETYLFLKLICNRILSLFFSRRSCRFTQIKIRKYIQKNLHNLQDLRAKNKLKQL